MTIYFSAKTNGFYSDGVHKEFPEDAIEISETKHKELLDRQSSGKIISSDDSGFPIVLEPPEPPAPTIDEQIAALEASVTPRNLRGAALGDQYAIDHIQSVEDHIQALRAQL